VSGLQFLLAFLNYDIANVPRRALHPALLRARRPVPLAG
jgi:dolichol-phosphate mannosyltransferase